jgi:uncharacterized coiled-coil protein SlyX
MPDPLDIRLPDFNAFRGYVVKELYGSTGVAKIVRWSDQMEKWAKDRAEEIKQAKARIKQLEAQVSDFEEVIAKMNDYEDVAQMASDVKRGIRDLDELWELVE